MTGRLWATEVAQVLETVVSEGPEYGDFLNPSKTKVWWATGILGQRGASPRWRSELILLEI
jgi:hypothetical protein